MIYLSRMNQSAINIPMNSNSSPRSPPTGTHETRMPSGTNRFISLFIPLAIITVVGLAKRSVMHLHHSWLSALAGRCVGPRSLELSFMPIPQRACSTRDRILEKPSWSVFSLHHLSRLSLNLYPGRLRPDFLSRCKWDKELKACAG